MGGLHSRDGAVPFGILLASSLWRISLGVLPILCSVAVCLVSSAFSSAFWLGCRRERVAWNEQVKLFFSGGIAPRARGAQDAGLSRERVTESVCDKWDSCSVLGRFLLSLRCRVAYACSVERCDIKKGVPTKPG